MAAQKISVIILGDGAVGKTSLLKMYDEKYENEGSIVSLSEVHLERQDMFGDLGSRSSFLPVGCCNRWLCIVADASAVAVAVAVACAVVVIVVVVVVVLVVVVVVVCIVFCESSRCCCWFRG